MKCACMCVSCACMCVSLSESVIFTYVYPYNIYTYIYLYIHLSIHTSIYTYCVSECINDIIKVCIMCMYICPRMHSICVFEYVCVCARACRHVLHVFNMFTQVSIVSISMFTRMHSVHDHSRTVPSANSSHSLPSNFLRCCSSTSRAQVYCFGAHCVAKKKNIRPMPFISIACFSCTHEQLRAMMFVEPKGHRCAVSCLLCLSDLYKEMDWCAFQNRTKM